jgi:oligosaccharide repeat unit polymerase
MIFLDFAIIFFASITILNYWVQRSVLYPPLIFCAVWLLDLVVMRLDLIEINYVHGNTLTIVAAGATAFSIGGLFASLMPREFLRIHLLSAKPKRTPDSLRNTVMIVLLCSLPLMFYETWQLGGGGLNILEQARTAMIESIQSEVRSLPMLMLGSFALFAISASLLFATEKLDWKFWVVTGAAFVGCILTTGRTNLLTLIAGLSVIRLLQKRQESVHDAMRLLRWPVILFVVLFIGLIFVDKNTEELAGGISGTATYAIYSVINYTEAPLAAFDNVVQRPADFTIASSHIFAFPLRLAAALHLTDYKAAPLLDSYTLVPFPTNVYTVFKFYFLELGIIGTLVLMCVIGLLHSMLYLKARKGGTFSIYLFACFIFPLLMVTFDDWYHSISKYLYSIVLGLLYFLLGSLQFRLMSAKRNLSSRSVS